MRKLSWLTVGCIAACVAQAIIAADNTRTLPSKDAPTGRSRLLIFSRSKEKVREQDEQPAPKTGAGRARLTKPASEAALRSERSATGLPAASAKATPSRPVVSATKPRSTIPVTATRDLPPSEDDDELIRKLFESDELDAAAAAKQPAGRAEAISKNVVDQGVAPDLNTESEAPLATRPKADRYRELLEATAPAKPQPANKVQAAAASETSARTTGAAGSTIRRVSSSAPNKADFEVNPFEADERPSKVVNARYDSEAGGRAKNEIQPVGTSATHAIHVKPNGPGATPPRATLSKKPEVSKTVTKSKLGSLEKPISEIAPPRTPIAGTNHSPQVDVQWEAKGEVTLGQECHCSLIVHNSGKIPCRDLVVEANLPDSVRLVDANPFPKGSSATLEWQFANLAAGEKKVIDLTMIPTAPGELAASAQVRFTGTAATSFNVSEPKLETAIKLAPEVRIGDPASATITVSNPGTGTAQNVVLKAALPAGLECKTGKEFVSEIGPLGPGESRVVRLGLIAAAGGDHALKVVAQSGSTDLKTASQASIRVLAPSLSLAASGPSLRYLNRATKYVLTATNNSNAASDNVRISQVIEPGFEFIKADHGGRWDAQRRTVSWFIGHLDPGQSAAVELDLMPKETGEFRQQFRVTGDSGVEAAAVVTTRVEGAASLVMEVKDAEDPIEVGSDMVYAISVRNDGSKSAGKVSVSCELPPDVELVNVDGPSQHILESGMLIFKPVAEIAAGDSVTYKVKIKGMAAGTMKLRARLTSESIQKPLIVEEATQFYAE